MDEEEDDNCNDSYFHADEDIDENVSDICWWLLDCGSEKTKHLINPDMQPADRATCYPKHFVYFSHNELSNCAV
jgi:hypothetical protein